MSPHPNQHRNLIRDAIVSLAQFGLHFRDADEPILAISLQLLLHHTLEYTVLGQPNTLTGTTSNSPFTIKGNSTGHLPFAHKQDLHLRLDAMIQRYSMNQHLNHPSAPPLLLYKLPELLSTIDQATLCYQQDIIQFLQFAEWCTTLSQHPTHMPTNPLTAPITDWHTYTPNLIHRHGTTPLSPPQGIHRLLSPVCMSLLHVTRYNSSPHS